MNYHNTFFSFLICTLIGISSLAAQAPAGPPRGAMKMPQMSDAEAAKFQQEMAQFQKEFEALSKEEQDQFFKSMDEAVKKIDDLSKTDEGKELLQKLESGTITDGELDSLVNQLVGEEPSKVEEKKEPIVEKAPEPEKPKVVLTTEHEKALDTINSFIAHTNAFIVKAATIPELPSKFQNWARSGAIKRESNQNWSSVKTDIEQLVSKANRLLDRNPTTKEYYHLDELLKNKALYNNLQKIVSSISKLEPEIEEIPLLGGKGMSAQSKVSFQKMLNEYHEAIHLLKLNDELNKLFVLFEPRAKGLREQEETAIKQAELSKRPGPPSAGKYRPIEQDYYSPTQSYDTPAQQPYRPVQAYTPLPSAGPIGRAAAGAEPTKKAPSKPSPSSKATDQKKDAKKEDKKDEGASPAQIKIPVEQEGVIRKIDEHLSAAAAILKESGLGEKSNETIIKNPEINISLAVEMMPDLTKELNIQKGALGELRRMHSKVKSRTMRSVIQKKLKQTFAKYEKQLNGFMNAIGAIEKEWDTIRSTITPEKRYAYFGEKIEIPAESDEETPSELAAIQLKIPAPYSLFEIRKLLAEVKNTIIHFVDDKLPGSKKP